MISDFFLSQVKQHFPFTPTAEQDEALTVLSNFLSEKDARALFLLKGYAGTGKSSLVGALVKTMTELKQPTVLLAPTGRAAKVFSGYAGKHAYTIHKKIYRQKAFAAEPTGFQLAPNLSKNTVFIVDEASMISNDGLDSFSFGSGRLLDDLVRYVYNGEDCRLILLGDSAQLPPVSQEESPALDVNRLEGYDLNVHSITLTQVVRQAEKSDILMQATRLRKAIEKRNVNVFPDLSPQGEESRAHNVASTSPLPLRGEVGGGAVKIVPDNELLETIEAAYSRDGQDETIVITRSNKSANLFNQNIRLRILWREEEISAGDWLLVAKNNYFWTETVKELDFIANGDLMLVRRVRKHHELYGFHFCDITAYFPDYDVEMDVKILLETLTVDAPGLPKEQNDKLFYTILEDYADLPIKKERMQKMRIDPFYNALQVKYAYAVTCHKAQGGQWKNVFLDLSYVPEEYLGMNFYRWLYTAFTRATGCLYLINPGKEMIPKNEKRSENINIDCCFAGSRNGFVAVLR